MGNLLPPLAGVLGSLDGFRIYSEKSGTMGTLRPPGWQLPILLFTVYNYLPTAQGNRRGTASGLGWTRDGDALARGDLRAHLDTVLSEGGCKRARELHIMSLQERIGPLDGNLKSST